MHISWTYGIETCIDNYTCLQYGGLVEKQVTETNIVFSFIELLIHYCDFKAFLSSTVLKLVCTVSNSSFISLHGQTKNYFVTVNLDNFVHALSQLVLNLAFVPSWV